MTIRPSDAIPRAAAERGDADAQFSLGLAYITGRGVEQNYSEAAAWWRRSAEQGNPDARYGLGNLYRRGEGVPQDYAESVRWFRRVAEQGDAGAQYSLGAAYAAGRGVDQDHVDAVRWYRLSAEQGDPFGQWGARNQVPLWRRRFDRLRRSLFVAEPCGGTWRRNGRQDRDEVAELMTSEQITDGQRMLRQLWNRIEADSGS